MDKVELKNFLKEGIQTKGWSSSTCDSYFKLFKDSNLKFIKQRIVRLMKLRKPGVTLYRFILKFGKEVGIEKWRRDVDGYIISEVGFCSGDVYISLNDVTDDLLYAIFSYKPHAMMGGIIEDYQKKVVPEVLQDLKKAALDIYNNFISKYLEYDIAPNYISKKAYVNSLKPNTKFKYKGCEWLYDGEYVSTENFDIGLSSPWWGDGVKRSDIRMKVTDKMLFEINDNSIVDEDTRFE